MLITFEGGEGAGKTSLIEHVALFLRKSGKSIIETREPGGTALGACVRKLLLTVDSEIKICPKAELMLYLTSRAQTVVEIIEPALKAGFIVLCDRFNDSTAVYQGAARGLDLDEVLRLCNFACGSLRPDLTFYLDVDPEIGLTRAEKTSKAEAQSGVKDRIESEALSFHEMVRAGYLRIAKQEPDRVVILDANRPQDLVLNDALKVLNKCLSS